jgi:hypothetical protein
MKAGATAFTRIPRLANSSAAVLVKPSTACLLAGLVALLSEMVGLVVKVPCPVSAGCDKDVITHKTTQEGDFPRLSLCELFGIELCALFGIIVSCS